METKSHTNNQKAIIVENSIMAIDDIESYLIVKIIEVDKTEVKTIVLGVSKELNIKKANMFMFDDEEHQIEIYSNSELIPIKQGTWFRTSFYPFLTPEKHLSIF